MAWYGYSLIALFANSLYTITQKWALNHNINKTKLLTYIFIGLFFCYLGYNLIIDFSGLQLQLQSTNFYLWGTLVAFLSLAGNIAHIKALSESPNPGYVQSIVITNSLVVLVFSAIIFNAPITAIKFVGIAMVLFGLYLLIINNSKKDKKTFGWQIPAILAMLFYGGMFLVVKQMTNIGVTPAQILLVLFLFAAIGFLIISRFQKVTLRFENEPKILILSIVLAIVIAFVANLLNFIAIKLVSNPGYSAAVFNSSVVLTLFFSSLIFAKKTGGEFNLKKWLAVFVTVIGVIIIILS